MRKGKEQQKNETSRQLKLFTMQAGELTGTPTGGTGTERLNRVELLSLLERQRTLTENLLERIVDYGNLMRAYKQVANNDGSGGIDGMEREELRQWLGKHINTLRATLLIEKYEVSAVRKVEIQKPDGGKRILGIPTVKDRLIQQAIHQELSRYYEPVFSESSYGFRPGRSAHQAIEQASKYIQEGKEWVVDIDLEKFFDKINHDRLMQRLSKGIGDKKLLRLINAYLKAGMMDDGLIEQRVSGTPQGGPLSPLLSNIVLDELDKELESRGHSFCRYADDCNIYVRSRKAGERIMTSIVVFIEKKLKLKVNNAKSGVRHCSNVKFLGYTLLPEGGIRVADKSIDRLKDRIREITRRNRGVKFEEVIRELNATIIGWTNYFRLANTWLTTFRELDGWIRRKLRCYRLKQCGRRYTIFKLLRSLNIPDSKCWNVVMYSQGWWQMSKKNAVGLAMNLNWFAQLGLQSLYLRMKV
jgi:group II intron reverse transcriptase/maturase